MCESHNLAILESQFFICFESPLVGCSNVGSFLLIRAKQLSNYRQLRRPATGRLDNLNNFADQLIE